MNYFSSNYRFFSLNFHVSGKFQKTEFVRGNGSSFPSSLRWWMSSINITRYSCCRLAASIWLLREWLDTIERNEMKSKQWIYYETRLKRHSHYFIEWTYSCEVLGWNPGCHNCTLSFAWISRNFRLASTCMCELTCLRVLVLPVRNFM